MWKNSEKIEVLKSVNLHIEYVPRCFRIQMQKKKVEHKVTSKKSHGQADILRMKKWENSSLIIT